MIKNNTKHAIFYLFIFVFCFALCLTNYQIDYDIFSRLIMGKHVAQTGAVMFNDIVSYTPVHIWYDHEWLSSTIVYFVLYSFGSLGLFVFKVILCFLTVFLIGKNINFITNSNDVKPFYTVCISIILYSIGLFSFFRCQDFTSVLIPLIIYLLEKIRYNYNTTVIYFIPLLMLFWLNTHGASLYGLLLIFLYGLGEFLNKKPYKKYFILLIPCILVYFINPWGFNFIKFMFSAVFVDRHWIGEWQSPFTMEINAVIEYIITLAVVITTLVYGSYKSKKQLGALDFTKVLVIIVFTIFSLKYIKHTRAFYIVFLIYLYNDFLLVFNKILSKLNIRKKLILNSLLYVTCFFFICYSFLNNPVLFVAQGDIISKFPVRPLEFISKNNIKGKILTQYSDGGYIAYKYYPDLKIYMDGRQEQVYDYEILDDLMKFLFYSRKDSNKVLEKYPPDIILLNNYWQANEYLTYQNYYKKVYDDGEFSVYLSPSVQKNKYEFPKFISDYNSKNFFDTKINFNKKAE